MREGDPTSVGNTLQLIREVTNCLLKVVIFPSPSQGFKEICLKSTLEGSQLCLKMIEYGNEFWTCSRVQIFQDWFSVTRLGFADISLMVSFKDGIRHSSQEMGSWMSSVTAVQGE